MKELKRKLIHLSSIWILFALHYQKLEEFRIFIFIICTFVILFDMARIYSPKLKAIVLFWFKDIMRNHELEDKLTGASYLLLSIFCCSFLANKTQLMLAISIVIFADGFAALIGKKYGKIKFMNKTIEGSIVFIVTSIISGFIIKNIYSLNNIWFLSASISSIIAGITELFSSKIKIDDNLTIPLSVVITMKIIGYLNGI